MIDFIGNLGVCILGPLSIWFLIHKQRWMRWGYIFGLASEPFWFMTAWNNRQWGVLVLVVIYTYCFTRGIWNYWVKDGI